MTEILTNLKNSISLLPQFSFTNLLEVVIIAAIVYELLLLIKNTRAWTLLKGILFILVFTLIAAIFRLDTILWILERISTIAVLAILIIFQPELRKALEQLGNQKIMTNILPLNDAPDTADMTRETVDQIVKATFEMGKQKTGALMVLERNESLADIEKTGIAIDGIISSGLLINIFEKNTPLHDGAVILKGNKVAAATCYLPLSEILSISKDLGTRHRAALGISEVTDSFTIVVSEETGRVTVASKGSLTRMPDAESLRVALLSLMEQEESKRTILPKVEKLLEVYDTLPNAQAKNDMLKSVLEKVVYLREERSPKGGPLDNFELTLYPKLPHTQK